jgi:hypothetical protein
VLKDLGVAPDRRLRLASSKMFSDAFTSRSSSFIQPPQTKVRIELHILDGPAQMAGFRWLPAIDLDQLFAQFGCHPLRLEQEISETKIANLSQPL